MGSLKNCSNFFNENFSFSHNIADMEFRSSRARLLWDKWRYVWMLTWERQRRLHEHQLYLQDLERVRMFSWEDWRKRFLKFMNHKKSRLTDLFRKMDKNNDGLIPREIFIDGIINTSKFLFFPFRIVSNFCVFLKNSTLLVWKWEQLQICLIETMKV